MNVNIQQIHYNHPDFMETFLKELDAESLHDVFLEMGLKMSTDDEGRVYPASYFSTTVLDVLCSHFGANVKMTCNYTVEKIRQVGNFWKINDFPLLFDKLIFATGSPAGMAAKNQKGYNGFLSDFKIKINPLVPSLVGFKLKHYPAQLSGCRTKALVSLLQDQRLLFQEKGEVIFKDDGISGIVILNASFYYNQLNDKKQSLISLNFLHDDPHYDWRLHLKKHHDLCGILHPKLNELFKRQPFDIQHFELEIDQPYGIDSAQVCRGGIALSEMNERLELIHYPNVYVIGELLDIDGVCGGYNLFFAFASALKVAKEIMHGN